MSTTCANVFSREDNLNGELTIDLPMTSNTLIITNLSGSGAMSVKFYTSMTEITLEPTETITIDFRTQKIILSGTNIDYKVWSFY